MSSLISSPVTGSNFVISRSCRPTTRSGSRCVVRREHLEGVALHAERAARAAHVVALVLDVDQALHRELERDVGAAVGPQDLPLVLLGRTQPVDARDAGDDDHVAPAEEGGGGRVPQPLDLLVHRAVLLDVGVGGRDVGLGLVVVVVADEYSTALSGNTSRNSLASWAPSDLLGAITKVGRATPPRHARS